MNGRGREKGRILLLSLSEKLDRIIVEGVGGVKPILLIVEFFGPSSGNLW